jgi:hypothetical protein
MSEIFSQKNLLTFLGIIVVAVIAFFVWNSNKKVAESLILQVPFTAQAPNGNWDRNEDCEETSIVMANAFLDGATNDRMPAAEAQKAINQLKTWEEANIGYNANTGADATTQMARGAFGILVKEIKNYTAEDLKSELSKNHVILLPINARLLDNPKYFDNGPLYHMIVVRGYRGDTFIVNDPGTEGGDGNEYTFDILKKAAADWDQNAKQMDPTRKIALILSK